MKTKRCIFAFMVCLIAFFAANKVSAQLAKGYYFVHVALDTHYCLDLHKAIV